MKEGYRYWIGTLAVKFLGVTFVVAGVGKLLAGPRGFEPFVLPVVLSQSLAEVIYSWIPYLEITIGGLLILGIAVKFATSLSALLILGFMTSNLLLIYLGVGFEPCGGCLGLVGELTAISALGLDVIMAAAVVAIFAYYQGGFFNITPMVLRKEKI